MIADDLRAIHRESVRKGYRVSAEKIDGGYDVGTIEVTWSDTPRAGQRPRSTPPRGERGERIRVHGLIGIILAVLVLIAPAGTFPGTADPEAGAGADVEGTVFRNLDAVRANLGGSCATPREAAYFELLELGDAAVPVLVSAREREEYRSIDAFILEVLSHLTCRDFTTPRPPEALARELETWWGENRNRSREEWILDAADEADPANTRRLAFALPEVRSPESLPRLISLLASPDPDIEAIVLYALWDNYRSEEALRHVRETFRNGAPAGRRTALRFAADREIAALDPDLVDFLGKEPDYGTLSIAIDVAGRRRIHDADSILARMEEEPDRYPIYNVIQARARIGRGAYRERLRLHLLHGERIERFGAVRVLDEVTGPGEALPLLLRAMRDPDSDVRRYALDTLRRVAPAASEDAVARAVADLIDGLRVEEDGDRIRTLDGALRRVTESRHRGQPEIDWSRDRPEWADVARTSWETWWEAVGPGRAAGQ